MAKVFNGDNLEFRMKDSPLPEFIWGTSQNLSKEVDSQQMHFDIRILEPDKYSYPYHYHRNAEEMIVVMSGNIMMRTPEGLSEINEGDVVFFEKGSKGAHQFYNHTDKPCKYLDIRIKVDLDVCDYPDTGKVNILPDRDMFYKTHPAEYFEGEDKVSDKWEELKK